MVFFIVFMRVVCDLAFKFRDVVALALGIMFFYFVVKKFLIFLFSV